MAASLSGISLPVMGPAGTATGMRAAPRRRIGSQAGRALEILGHAIEYLIDEYVEEGGLFSAHDPRLQAIQLLMGRNREVYYACPELPAFRQRVRAWLHIQPRIARTP